MTRRVARYIHRGATVEIDSTTACATLLDHLRLDRRAVGTKEGCNEGDCGACTVVLARMKNGRLVHEAVNSCILLAGQIDGAELITVEDLATDGALHPVQAAMVENHGSQCGFCTPGIVMSLFALYQQGDRPVTRDRVNDQLAGNLCRCTGYRPIIAAALAACADNPADRFALAAGERAAALAGIADDDDVFAGDDNSFFAAPASLESLGTLYARHPDAVLLGGATDVGLWRTKKLQDLPKIIWLGRVAGLDRLETSADGLDIGATVTLADAHAALAGIDPDIGELVRRFGSAQVRASATVGGNIANGSPIGDLAPCLIALGAEVTLQKGDVLRRMPLEAFFIAYGKQDRQPGEFVRMLHVPRLKADEMYRCFKVSKRFDEDISSVMGAFRLSVTGRVVARARVAFGGMAATPRRGAGTEAALTGLSLDDPSTWVAGIEALGADYQPIDDMRASGAYRLATARALLQKALFECSAAPTTMTRVIGHRPTAQGAA